ncbi:MAG: tRNA epoxyqueuosine(34) reductase QueG [Bdellovibrionales bacterium]|nr:tRNA epoxyqueuosine(34) reductase QueG [Bdellovibrionales bacterium]
MTSFGFSQAGWVALRTPISMPYYEKWIEQNRHGNMDYMVRHMPEKREPQRLLKSAQSAFVLTHPYYPHPSPSALPNLKIAKYARGADYHHWISSKVETAIQELKKGFPNEDFAGFVDSKPVLERELAHRAGLGWIGKNTCLIDQKLGSYNFIAEIYSTLKCPIPDVMHPDRCGTCTRCIDACPTKALDTENGLDSRKCISYLTIEDREFSPNQWIKETQGWYFGCDICQDVCPWNQKPIQKSSSLENPVPNETENNNQALKKILSSSNSQLREMFKGTPLLRAAPNAHRRNSLYVILSEQRRELLPYVEKLLCHDKLGELARYVMDQLGSKT